jgi:CheY-like chemotaxis protein
MDDAKRSGKVVLAIDDQMENLLLLEGLITARGYAFFGAASGAEGLSLASRTFPRLILLDLQMPEMDGFETCRRVRAIPELQQTPIAFLTGSKSSADVATGMAAGGNDFILKPFDIDRLLTRVDYWTSRRLGAVGAHR